MRTRLLLYPTTFLLAVLVVTQVWDIYRVQHVQGDDFAGTVWYPARAVLQSLPPYPHPPPGLIPTATYPPPLFVTLAPLGWLSLHEALIAWQMLLVLAAVGTLLVLRVRDVRCWALWLLSAPVFDDLLWGNATLLIVFCAAVTWRWRDRWPVAAAAMGGAVAVKLFLAPLAVWLLLTRRYKAAVGAAAVAAALITTSWAVISFRGFGVYPHVLSRLAQTAGGYGILLQALVRQTGGSQRSALLIGLAVSFGLVIAAAFSRTDLTVYTLVLLACLALTPVTWIFYPALLIVPVAVRWPRLTWGWAVFPVFWVAWSYSPLPWGQWQQSLVCIAATGIAAAAICRGHNTAVRITGRRTAPSATPRMADESRLVRPVG